jgi:peptidyl-prolyl cis-trans isomerase C
MKVAFGPLTGLLLACAALAACGDKSGDGEARKEDPVVATVDGDEIRQSEIDAIYQSLPPQYRQLPLEFLQAQLVEGLIAQKLAADAAREAGLDKDPDYKARVKRVENQILEDMWIDRQVEKGLTPERLKQAYDAAPKREVKASHILVKTEEEAKAIIDALAKGGDFAALAREKSLDTGSGAAGGELGYFQPDQMVPEFAEAVTALKPGEVSKTPVKSQFGYHVIKVEDSRTVSFEDSEAELRAQETEKLRDEVMAQLRDKAKIEKVEPAADKTTGHEGEAAPAGAAEPAK